MQQNIKIAVLEAPRQHAAFSCYAARRGVKIAFTLSKMLPYFVAYDM